MQVFITGGSGFVGRAVLAEIAAHGLAARVLVRDPASPRARALQRCGDVELLAGDVLEPATLQPGLRGCDAVIHLVGIISEIGRNTFENAHRVATANVVGAATAAGVRRFIQMSALGTRPGAVSRYHQTKWSAEETVRSSPLAWTILRPSLIYGPGDHFTNLFAAMARWSPVLPVMGPGHAKLQPIGVEAVARAFVRAALEPRSARATLDLCGPAPLSFNGVLDEILRVLGRRRLKLHVPLPLARLQARVLEFVFPRLLGRAAPLNRDQLLMLQEDNVGEPSQANALFGLPVESFRDGIRRYLKRA